jgi:hypothetical protein
MTTPDDDHVAHGPDPADYLGPAPRILPNQEPDPARRTYDAASVDLRIGGQRMQVRSWSARAS